MSNIVNKLKQYFGHEEFKIGQEELINCTLSRRDCIGIMPTGAGKSICYQLPAIMSQGITLVVSPLISLMKDQVDALVQSGIKAAFLNSSLNFAQQNKVLQNAMQGHYKIIYVAPERLLVDSFVQFARECQLFMIAIDEAHCVSQWGQDFRPSYLDIAKFIDKLPKRPVVCAYTATATEFVKQDIKRLLQLKNPFEKTTGFDRKNLYFEVQKPKDKFVALLNYLKNNKDKSGIVYCSTRDNVEYVCDNLNSNGYNATRYHAGLSEKEKTHNQNDFLYDKKSVMVATNAFGMGIDKSNVSFVVHYNMPKNMESYYQEAGRAGRDGSDAKCLLLFGGKDIVTNGYFIENTSQDNNLSPQVLEVIKQKDRERLRQMTYYCQTNECLRQFILDYFEDKSVCKCDNCSNCLQEFETIDITIQAQKIMSCIARMGEKYGIKVLIDTLRGSKSEKVTSFGLDKIKTYGIMSQTSAVKIREIINFLLIKQYVELTNSQYPTIKLTDKSKQILFDSQQLFMKISNKENYNEFDYDDDDNSSRQSRRKQYSKNLQLTKIYDRELFSVLQQLRTKIASEQKVPAYIIFADNTLVDMCKKKPSNQKEFLDVSGVGQFKLDKYGEQFLRAIEEYNKNE